VLRVDSRRHARVSQTGETLMWRKLFEERHRGWITIYLGLAVFLALMTWGVWMDVK
jgi:hypothetical protein